MSNNAIEFITGPVMYPRITEESRNLTGYENAYVPFDGMYEICIGVTPGGDDYKKIFTWNKNYEPRIGGQAKGFEIDRGAVEGLAYFTFKRKHKHVLPSGEVAVKWSGEPKLWARDAKGGKTAFDKATTIGNGTVATLKLNVATMAKNPRIKIVRLEEVMIEKLVEYVKADKAQEEQVPAKDVMLDDDIPF